MYVSVTIKDHIIMFVPSRSLSTLVINYCRFGGRGNYHNYYNDTWAFDISTRKWTELQCTGSIPSPRSGHAAVLVGGVMYVFGGGSTDDTCVDDLYALQLSSE
jgi:N-acetylneuraminic acid mutarotase